MGRALDDGAVEFRAVEPLHGADAEVIEPKIPIVVNEFLQFIGVLVHKLGELGVQHVTETVPGCAHTPIGLAVEVGDGDPGRERLVLGRHGLVGDADGGGQGIDILRLHHVGHVCDHLSDHHPKIKGRGVQPPRQFFEASGDLLEIDLFARSISLQNMHRLWFVRGHAVRR